jgi:hypothetical protein
VFAKSIRHILARANHEYSVLMACGPAPHVIDDDSLDRVLASYEEMLIDLSSFEVQIEKWGKEKLTARQRKQVEAVAGRFRHAIAAVESVITLAENIRNGAIDTVLAKQ